MKKIISPLVAVMVTAGSVALAQDPPKKALKPVTNTVNKPSAPPPATGKTTPEARTSKAHKGGKKIAGPKVQKQIAPKKVQ